MNFFQITLMSPWDEYWLFYLKTIFEKIVTKTTKYNIFMLFKVTVGDVGDLIQCSNYKVLN